MITPGLLRRALARAAQWRLLALQLISLAIAGWIAARPFSAFLEKQLGHLPDAKALMPSLGGRVLLDLVMQAAQDNLHPEQALGAGLLLSVIFGAFFAGAVLTVAQDDEAPRSRALLAGAGAWFGRMIRSVFAGLIPYGIAAAITAGIFRWADKAGERALTEHAADHAMHLALLISALAFFLATLWLDAARAMFVAQPARRSAFFAVFAGGLFFLRRFFRSLAIGIGTLLLSLLLAAVVVIWRQHLAQSSGGKVLLALLLAQLALVLLAWGRAARLIAFVELARADQLARQKKKERSTFEMEPPRTSPPPVATPSPSSPLPMAPAPAPLPDSFRSLPTVPEAAPVNVVAVPSIAGAELPSPLIAVETIAVVAIEVPEPEVSPSLPPPPIAASGSGSGTGSGN